LKITKIRKVKTPSKAHSYDAGLDFFVPEEDLSAIVTGELIKAYTNGVMVLPQGRVLIPSGLKINVPEGWTLVAFNKSGVASKKGLVVGAQVIDHGYQGEVHINVINTSHEPVTIHQGDKLVQFLMMAVPHIEIEEVNEAALFEKESSRSDRGFGSSGNH
jgi:dUTP pyrophosphatase